MLSVIKVALWMCWAQTNFVSKVVIACRLGLNNFIYLFFLATWKNKSELCI